MAPDTLFVGVFVTNGAGGSSFAGYWRTSADARVADLRAFLAKSLQGNPREEGLVLLVGARLMASTETLRAYVSADDGALTEAASLKVYVTIRSNAYANGENGKRPGERRPILTVDRVPRADVPLDLRVPDDVDLDATQDNAGAGYSQIPQSSQPSDVGPSGSVPSDVLDAIHELSQFTGAAHIQSTASVTGATQSTESVPGITRSTSSAPGATQSTSSPPEATQSTSSPPETTQSPPFTPSVGASWASALAGPDTHNAPETWFLDIEDVLMESSESLALQRHWDALDATAQVAFQLQLSRFELLVERALISDEHHLPLALEAALKQLIFGIGLSPKYDRLEIGFRRRFGPKASYAAYLFILQHIDARVQSWRSAEPLREHHGAPPPHANVHIADPSAVDDTRVYVIDLTFFLSLVPSILFIFVRAFFFAWFCGLLMIPGKRLFVAGLVLAWCIFDSYRLVARRLVARDRVHFDVHVENGRHVIEQRARGHDLGQGLGLGHAPHGDHARNADPDLNNARRRSRRHSRAASSARSPWSVSYWIRRLATFNLNEEALELGLDAHYIDGQLYTRNPNRPRTRGRPRRASPPSHLARAWRTFQVGLVLFLGTLHPKFDRRRARALARRKELLDLSDAARRAEQEQEQAPQPHVLPDHDAPVPEPAHLESESDDDDDENAEPVLVA